jgi:hypothetical protein
MSKERVESSAKIAVTGVVLGTRTKAVDNGLENLPMWIPMDGGDN